MSASAGGRAIAWTPPLTMATGQRFPTATEDGFSAVIVNYESGTLLLSCVQSVLQQSLPAQVIVVDNGSTDGSVDALLDRFPDVEVVRPGRNLGFAAGANAGARFAGGRYLLFLNPDARLEPGCLDAFRRVLEDEKVAVTGPVVSLSASKTLEFGYTIDLLGHPVALPEPTRPPLFIPGCALVTRTSVFRQLGGFDERFFMFVEDVDYCWRVLLCGWEVHLATGAVVGHLGGASARGGYLTASGLRTTRFRVYLRERNTLAMLIKCYGLVSAALLVPLYVLQALASALLLACVGKHRTGRDIIAGLLWNVREWSSTSARRRAVQLARRVSDRTVRRRMHRGVRKLELLVRYGVPDVDEAWAPVAKSSGANTSSSSPFPRGDGRSRGEGAA